MELLVSALSSEKWSGSRLTGVIPSEIEAGALLLFGLRALSLILAL